MPSGQYPRTEDHRRRIRDGTLRRWQRVSKQERRAIAEKISVRMKAIWRSWKQMGWR